MKQKIRGFEPVIEIMRKNSNEAILPQRGTEDAMAYDLIAPTDMVIKPGEIGKIWTDVKVYMQKNECFIINVRSSQGGKVMLANTQGWIESDYYSSKENDGNLGIFLKNIGKEDYIIKRGDRVAQGAFFNFLVADNCNTKNKRTGGFGSTGV